MFKRPPGPKFLFFGLLVCIACALPASAETYPIRPIRMVVGYPPGGTTDILARIMAAELTQRLGQTVVVENRTGAAGIIGTADVARAAGDGYTILMGASSAYAYEPAIRENLPYQPKDLKMFALIGSASNVLVVRPDAPYKSLSDVIAAAKAQPGKLSHGSTGIGATPQLTMALLKKSAKVDIIDVPFGGGGPVEQALLGGHVDMTFDGLASARSKIEAGQFRPLAVSGKQRVKWMPDVPTLAESGFPGLEVEAWYALFAPSSTPDSILEKLHQSADEALTVNDIKLRIEQLGMDPAPPQNLQELSSFSGAEIGRWANFVKITGLKVHD
ncbi:putative secreted protein [Bordetella petrii]|uniref:Secreted protein n=2 Tax=Bordetella petrii TaxID=94624 RepID=A9IBF8_BORPD|nr:putative secreted protein [Bordetella petrii]